MAARPEPSKSAPVAWPELIGRHDHKVFISLLALGIAPDRARELAQATWTRLLEQHTRGGLTQLELPGLAIRQARFLALDDLRRRGAERRRLEDAAALADIVSDTDLERQVASRERLDRALGALATCSQTAQTLFRLLYVPPGCTQTEAAAELGLSLQRIRQILCETRARIRSALDDKETP